VVWIKPTKGAKRRHGAIAAGLGAVLVVAGQGIGFLGGDADATATESPPAPAALPFTAADRIALNDAEDRIATFDDHARSGAPFITACTNLPFDSERMNCAVAGARLADSWPRAWRGDLVAQRVVSACFADGCSGAVAADRVQGCAWSLVVLSRGTKDANIDAIGARERCSQLDAYALGAAKARAFEILRRTS
jgi:hypothetical protein